MQNTQKFVLHGNLHSFTKTKRKGGGGGGLQNGRGGYVKFYPYKKGVGKSLSHAEGGGIKSFGVVFTR